jgi:uncharacterized membrane protein YbhN (UPF0104 family)
VKRSRLWTAFKCLLGVGIIVWLIATNWHKEGPTGDDVGLATVDLTPLNYYALAAAALICAVSVLLTFVRWYVLVRAQGLPFTVAGALRLGMFGFYLSQFLPGSVSGDVVKAAYLAREQSRRTVAVATVLLDRAVGLSGLFWLVTISGLFFWGTGLVHTLTTNPEGYLALEFIFRGAAILSGVTLGFWILLGFLPARRVEIFAGRLLKIPKAGVSLAEFWRAVWMYRCRSRAVLLAMGMAMIGHVGFVFTFYFSALTLSAADQIPPFEAHLLIVPVGMTIQAGFPTPNGVGGGEWAYGELYALLGSTVACGLLGSLVQRCVIWVISLAGFLVYLRMRSGPPLADQESAQELASAPA